MWRPAREARLRAAGSVASAICIFALSGGIGDRKGGMASAKSTRRRRAIKQHGVVFVSSVILIVYLRRAFPRRDDDPLAEPSWRCYQWHGIDVEMPAADSS